MSYLKIDYFYYFATACFWKCCGSLSYCRLFFPLERLDHSPPLLPELRVFSDYSNGPGVFVRGLVAVGVNAKVVLDHSNVDRLIDCVCYSLSIMQIALKIIKPYFPS